MDGETHARDGDKSLLSYNIAKGPETSNPLDPSSEPTGNTCYALNEVYEAKPASTTTGSKPKTGSTSATCSPGPANAKSQPCTARRSSVRIGKPAVAQRPVLRERFALGWSCGVDPVAVDASGRCFD